MLAVAVEIFNRHSPPPYSEHRVVSLDTKVEMFRDMGYRAFTLDRSQSLVRGFCRIQLGYGTTLPTIELRNNCVPSPVSTDLCYVSVVELKII